MVGVSRFSCAVCGVGGQDAGGLSANPLAAWDTGWDGARLCVRREQPAVAARSAGRLLSVDNECAVVEGLPTASSAELGAARVLEQRLRTAANIPVLSKRSPENSRVGKRCARLPVPHSSAYLDDSSTGGRGLSSAWAQSLTLTVRLALKGLPLGADKCNFLRERLPLLGVELFHNSVQLGAKALGKLLVSEIPSSIKEL